MGAKKVLMIILFAVLLSSCQWGARTFGGTVEVRLPAGKKLVTATWKDADLWYLVRDRRQGEPVETLVFEESSALGIAEGKVIFYETE